MSRLVRASAVVASAFLAVPLFGTPAAYADDTVLVPTSSGYFNADGIRKPDDSPAAPPNVTSNAADGVAPEHLAVAARTGQENKVSFLLFDLFEIDPGATVTKAVLTLPLAPNDPQKGNASFEHAPNKVIACMAGSEGFGGDDGTSTVDAPKRLCDKGAVVGAATADGSAYAFDVTKMAQAWLEVNDGVALTSAPEQRSSAFQVVFKPATEAKLALSFTPGPDADLGLPTLPTPPDTTTTSTGTDSADFGGSFDSGTVTTVESSGGFGAVEEPLVSVDAPVAEAAPAEEAVAAPSVATTVPVASMRAASSTPSLSFWVGLLLLGGLLALISLIVGDPRVPQGATSQTRLTQALQARERASGGGAPQRSSLS